MESGVFSVQCRAEPHSALLHIIAVSKLSAVVPSNAFVNTHSTQQWEYGVSYAVSATIVAGQWFSKLSFAKIWGICVFTVVRAEGLS
jgi:uncharacterized protein with von Willebrand factor type A (vWA) domain